MRSAMNDNTPQKTNIKPYLIIALLGFIVAWQSWKAGEALGDSFIFKLGVLFALGGLFITSTTWESPPPHNRDSD